MRRSNLTPPNLLVPPNYNIFYKYPPTSIHYHPPNYQFQADPLFIRPVLAIREGRVTEIKLTLPQNVISEGYKFFLASKGDTNFL